MAEMKENYTKTQNESQSDPLIRVILGAGPRWEKVRNDMYHDVLVDLRPFENEGHKIDIVADLNDKFPFENNSVDEITAIHLVEHLDDLVHFMDECHRVLRPGGSLYIETPNAGVNADIEWSDPTHKRCFRIHTFANYFSLSGVKKFGYTDRPWNFFVLEPIHNDTVIKVHAYPIKR